MYHASFGLREAPFALTPDPKYLFLTDGHREAIASIVYGVEQRRGFVLVVGEVGTGKTTLVRHVLRHFGDEIRTVYLFRTITTIDELLASVLRDLEIPGPHTDRAAMVDRLNEFLLAERAAGRTVVVIIDEAQHLRPAILEELRMLSNLETAQSKLLQIVLVAQPEISRMLARHSMRQVRQRIGLVAELGPLTPAETAQYVAYRMTTAGYRGAPVFTRAALRAVHEASGGIPRLVNVICDKALVLAFAAGSGRVRARIIRRVVRDWEVFRLPAHGPPTRARRQTSRRVLLPAVAGVAAAVVAVLWAGSWPSPWGAAQRPAAVERAEPSPDGSSADGSSEGAATPVTAEPAAGAAAPAPVAAVMTEGEPAKNEPANDLPPRSSPVPDVTVRRGETLEEIALRVYGRSDLTVLDVVKAANPSVEDVNRIAVGQRLATPPLTPERMVRPDRDGRYRVHVMTTADKASADVESLRASLRGSGRSVSFVPVRLGPGVAAYRVMVGDFADAGPARRYYRTLAGARGAVMENVDE